MGFASTWIMLEGLNRFLLRHDYRDSMSTTSYAQKYLLPETPGELTDLSTLDHIRAMKQSGDNDTLNLLTLAYEVKGQSQEFSYMLLHLAHLKSPEMIGANSSLQFDLDEIKEGVERLSIENASSELGDGGQ